MGGTALAVLLLAGCRKPAPEETAPAVTVLTVESTRFADPIVAAGSIVPVRSVQLAFRVPGQVIAVEAADGDVVEAGAVVARMERTESEHAVVIAQARADELRSRHERLDRLHAAGSLTQTDFEKSQAAVKEAEAALDLARERLGYTVLAAPFTGRLIKLGAEVGTVVAPGQPIFTLMAEAPVWAEVHVAESDRTALADGQTVTLEVPALAGLDATGGASPPLEGTIESIAAAAEPLSRTFTARIRLPNDDRRLRLGHLVTAHIDTRRSREGILLPPAAVRREPDGSLYVWVLDGTGKQVNKRSVSAGGAQEQKVIIDQGLAAGDRVVIGATAPLFDNRAVRVAAP